MSNIAYHRTNAENAPAILKNGILSFASRGLTLTHPRDDAEAYMADRAALETAGFKFRIPAITSEQEHDVLGFTFWHRDAYEAMSRSESTFVRMGGVQKVWSPNGVTIAIDMSKVTADTMDDGFGTYDCGDGIKDVQVCGDIPASAIMGIVTDAQIDSYGGVVEYDGYND